MIKMFGNKRMGESSNQDDKKQSWKQSVKTFFLILVALFGLCTIIATGGGSDSGSSSSTTSGTVSGSGK